MLLSSAVIDTSIITELLGVAKSAIGFLNEFPLNVFLYAGFLRTGIGLFGTGRNAVN